MRKLAAKFITSTLVSLSFFGANAFAQDQQFSEDINFVPATEVQVAAVTPAGGNFGKSNVNFSQLAGHFSAFVKETQQAATPEGLSSANSIGKFLDHSPALTGGQTIDGAKAMVVITALSNPKFVASVKQVSQFMGEEAFSAKLQAEPSMVHNFDGYSNVRKTAAASLGLGMQKVDKASDYITQASYDLQKFPWAKAAYDKHIHLSALANSKKAPSNYTPINVNEIVDSNEVEAQINDKLFAAAALVAIGKENEAIAMMKLGSGEYCAQDAYLTLRMCVSASKYPFEHSFCLAKHAYADTNICMKKALK